MRRLKICNKIRPFLPVLIGLSLGFSMSIIRMPISHEDCLHLSKDHVDRKLLLKDGKDEYMDRKLDPFGFQPMNKDEAERYRKDRQFAPPIYDSVDDFEPRIITDPELKPKIEFDAEKNKKKVVRTRYISTELGIREKLVCAVLTTPNTFSTLGTAMNKTFTHLMQKVVFFEGLGDPSSDKPSSAFGITLVSHPTSQRARILFETLNHLYNKFSSEYDWFFLATDKTYSSANRINYIVDHISINRRLILGNPVPASDSSVGSFSYCEIKHGMLISRLLLLDIVPFLHKCLQDPDIDEIPSDRWFGRCVKRATRGAVDCTDHEEGIIYKTFDLDDTPRNFNVDSEDASSFKDAATVSGVEDTRTMYQLHKRFSQIQIDSAYKEIVEIQDEIAELAPKLPEGETELSWPIGINPSFKPTNRWDIIVWDYFTEDYTLTCPGEIPKCELNGIDKLDVQNIIQIAISRLNEKYSPQGLVIEKKKLINGYRRFDPQRGMEYILDLLLNIVIEEEKKEIELSHRVDLLRPLSEVEIIPMPYVTESAKVNIILPITAHDRPYFEAFLDSYAKVCLNAGENAGLSVVFIYDPDNAAKIKSNDLFVEQKDLLQQYETRYRNDKGDAKLIPWISIKTEVPSQLKIMDIISKKFTDDTLFFLASVASNMNSNFLNRCRMNTIQGWQSFFPIPFSQYNPDIVFKKSPVPENIEVKPTTGRFDIYSFDEVCIYKSDYTTAKSNLAASVNVQETQGTISGAIDTHDVYDLLVKYSQLHVFRAVEPQLTRRYLHRNCEIQNGDDIFHRCERSNAEGLASRTQLAMDLFPDDK